MIDETEIKNRVTYHSPSPEGVTKHAQLSNVIEAAMQLVAAIVPPGREQSIVFTKLEEAKMWASAGVARNPETR